MNDSVALHSEQADWIDFGLTSPTAHTEVQQRPRSRMWRAVALVALVAGGIFLGWYTGATEHLTRDNIKMWVAAAGIAGFFLYIGLYTVGHFLQVPGWVFISSAAFAWGPELGLAVALVGATFAVSFNFSLVRLIGGRLLVGLDKPFIRKMLIHLEKNPTLTVVVARGIGMSSPPMTFAFAMSSVRFRDHLVGSFIGMTPQATIVAFVAHQVLQSAS